MKSLSLGLIAFLATAGLSSAAYAQTKPAVHDDTQIQDIRCLIVSVMMNTSPDPQAKAASGGMTMFFLGRLDGRAPVMNLEAAIRAELPKVTDAETAILTKSCGAQLAARGQALATAGESIGKNPTAAPAPAKPAAGKPAAAPAPAKTPATPKPAPAKP
jgi:hypothetical protein